MSISDIVGVVSGLLAIFTFLTGVTSVRELRRPRPAGEDRQIAVRQRSRSRLVLWLSIPGFLISLAVTLSQGLNGSDTGGAQFLLLLGGGLLLLLYATALHRSLSWEKFLGLCVVLLGGAGLAFGSISRGEEAAGLIAGVVIGAGVGLLGLPFRSPASRPGGRLPLADAASDRVLSGQQEKEVLGLAARQRGQVRVSEVALHTSLTLDEARSALDRLAMQDFCQKRSLPGGSTIYLFPDLLSG